MYRVELHESHVRGYLFIETRDTKLGIHTYSTFYVHLRILDPRSTSSQCPPLNASNIHVVVDIACFLVEVSAAEYYMYERAKPRKYTHLRRLGYCRMGVGNNL